jgi:hypothetical protein
VNGDAEHCGNLISSIYLSEQDLEAHNIYLNDKYKQMAENETPSESFMTEELQSDGVPCSSPEADCDQCQVVLGLLENLEGRVPKACTGALIYNKYHIRQSQGDRPPHLRSARCQPRPSPHGPCTPWP